MLQLIPGWGHVLGKKSRRRPRRRPAASDLRYRRAAFEELEQRRLLSANYEHIANSLDIELLAMQGRIITALNTVQTGLTSQVPLVGNKLGNAAQFVSQFSQELKLGIADLGTDATPTEAEIQASLTSHLSDFLGGTSVTVQTSGSTTTVEMLLQHSIVSADTSVSFDTGLLSLPISISAAGTLDVSVGFALNLKFTINTSNESVFINSNSGTNINGAAAPDANHPIVDYNNPLAIFVSATPSASFHANATFGFVSGTAAPLSGSPNGLYVTALISNLVNTPTIKLDGSADANLRLTGSFAGTGDDFPGISTDFHLHWGLSSSDPSSGAPTVSFDNVSLNFGKFISNVLSPVLHDIKNATDPLKPVVDFLTTEVPGMTDLSKAAGAGSITVGDLASLASQVVGAGPLADLVLKVVSVLDRIDDLVLGPNISMPLGGFDLDSSTNGDLRSAAIAGDLSNLDLGSLTSFAAANVQAAAQSYHDFVNGLDVDPGVKDTLNGLVAIPNNGFEIAFPILDDPAGVVFSMLLGRDADLFYFKADADISLEGSRASGLSVFGQGVNYVGEASLQAHLKFAYDTFGVRELINHIADGNFDDIFSDITDGFYIKSDSYVRVAGAIGAVAGGSNGIFGAKIIGGLSTPNHGADPVSVQIIDPNEDGKLRISEFDNDRAFILSGSVDAGLGVEIQIGTEIFGKFIGIKKRFDIANEVILQFADPTPPVLASQPDANGHITLYLGQNAYLRTGFGLDQIDGDESFTIRHLADNPAGGEDIKISAFGVTQTIKNVRSIEATDGVGTLVINVLPGVTSSVYFVGGQGEATLSYRGTGDAELHSGVLASDLTGGGGANVLVGGDGDDTIVLGSGSNNVNGGGGHNTIVVEAPILQNAVVSGGSNGNNSLQILGNPETAAISAVPLGGAIDIGIQNTLEDPAVHLSISNIGDVFVSAQDSNTNFTLGDLAAVGVHDLTLNIVAAFTTTRTIDLDTRIGNAPSTVALHDFVHEYEDPQNAGVTITEHGATIANSTTGLTALMLGFGGNDTMTLRHHGGTLDFDPLAFTSGHFILDTSARNAGQAEALSITLASRDNPTITMLNDAGYVLLTMTSHASFKILGSTALDSLSLHVEAAQSGANTMSVDASSLHGQLKLYMLGDDLAVDHLTFSKAASDTDTYIYGQDTTTDLMFGTGQLARIQHDVYASNVQLSIDNSAAAVGGYFKLTATTFGNWLIPTLGASAHLNFSGLRSDMEIFAAAGDSFQLDVTPPSITSLTMHNASELVQDVVYTANWVVPLALIGNFAFFAGRTLNEDGSFNRVKRLVNIHSAVTLDFHGDAPSQVVLDGDADDPGAEYMLGKNKVVNSTVGLSVSISGYGALDTLYVYMPGAHMEAELPTTSIGQIYFDGQARLSGTNPTAPNTISIRARYGEAHLTPLDTYNSLLDNGNQVYLLGSMPQDALSVSMPTNVVIAAGQASQLNLALNPDSYATVGGWDGASLITWMDGPRPTDTGGFFVFENVSRTTWATVGPGNGSGTWPNPYIEQPYGIVMKYVDSSPSDPLTVTYWYYQFVDGVRTLLHTIYEGVGRFWTVDPNPVAVDNDVQLNASQLRGTFQFNVSGPDYAYVRLLARESLRAVTNAFVSYNAPFYTWGSSYDLSRIAFGQSNIVLTDVNPQLSVNIDSANKKFTYLPDDFGDAGSERRVIRSDYPVTSLNVGAGTLAKIQGNVTVQNMVVTVDNSASSSANNLIMTATTLGNWITTDGTTNPVITMGQLDNRPFTVIAGVLDRIGIEGIPVTASFTSIQTTNDSTAPVNVYVMGRNATSTLRVLGNINLFVGRRLNADGTVTKVGNVAGVFATHNPISYQFTGTNGHGQLVYDASASIGGQLALLPAAGDPTKEALYFNNSVNYLLFGSNIDVEYDEPVVQTSSRGLIDHRLNGTVHYVANSQGPVSRVIVTTAYGPIQVDGQGVNTQVEINPAAASTMGVASNPPGNDLLTTILAPIIVTNAMLAIRPDTTSTTAPAQPKDIVIGSNEITGIAGAPIQYSNLRDTPARGYTPAFIVQMPRFASNLTVTGTPAGVTTAPKVIGQSVINTVVTGASGRLSFGTFDSFSNYQTFDTGEISYATQSLTIGNGTLQNILGEVLIGQTGQFTSTNGIVIDDRNDTTSHDVTFKPAAATGAPTITGLSAGSIGLKQAPGGLTVYGPAASHWTMQSIESLGPGTMYAGLGTIVDLAGPVSTFGNSQIIPRWQILGASTVRLNPGSGSAKVSNAQFPIIKADPARPTEIMQLIVDHTNANAVYFDDNSVPAGIVNYLQVLDTAPGGFGRISLGSSTNLQTEVEYQLSTTQLTLTGGRISSEQINVLDTGPLKTTISPNFSQVNVLSTTGPLDILQPSSGSPAKIFLGNAGDMQGIHGEITLRGDNAALPTLQATLDMSGESSDHTVIISNLSSTQADIIGIAPVAIHVVGSLITASLKGGTGNNTLFGPDAANAWVINAADGGTLNTRYSFSGFRTLTGGTDADTFRFTPAGSLAGNLDGGPGVDTLTYDNAATWHTLPYDLANGIAPLVGGTASHLEIVPTESTGIGNQANRAGDVVSISPLSIFGGLGNFTFTATGLPDGLSIDPTTGLVTGTIDPQMFGQQAVHVSATDGYNPASTDFTWTVARHIPTLAELNNGTPPGGPILAGILEPNSYSYLSANYYGVTYQHGAAEHQVVYFVVYTNGGFGSELWQYDNGSISQVHSIDADHELPSYEFRLTTIPGHGVIFNDNDLNIWLVDEAGARVISTDGYEINGDTFLAGGRIFLSVYRYDSSSGSYLHSVVNIQFDESGAATFTNVIDSANVEKLTAFAGGIFYAVYDYSTSSTMLKWFDPVSGLSRVIAASEHWADTLGVTTEPGGTENLFYSVYTSSGQTEIRVLNSAQLQSDTPVSTTLATVDQISSSLVVNNRLVFMTVAYGDDGRMNQFWISDGTVAGTQAAGQPLRDSESFGEISYKAVVGTDLYFAYFPPFDYGNITPDTIVAQIWKLDTVNGTLAPVVDFYGQEFAYSRIQELVANGDRLYFIAWDPTLERSNFWVYVPGVGASAVPQKADNQYLDPNEASSIGGSLFFTARSEAVVDINGDPTSQPWILVPATAEPDLPGDFNHDGSVDAADYVVWRKTLNTQETYDIWRANFGRSLTSGSGASAAANGSSVANAPVDLASSDPGSRDAKTSDDSVAASALEPPSVADDYRLAASFQPELAPADSTRPSQSHDSTQLTKSLLAETVFAAFGLDAAALQPLRAARSFKEPVSTMDSASPRDSRRRNDLLIGTAGQPGDFEIQELPAFDFDILSKDESQSDSEELSPNAIEVAFALSALD